jgi:hypothetical protein
MRLLAQRLENGVRIELKIPVTRCYGWVAGLVAGE